ncbi:MAG: hypothetical protein ABSG43_18910 [Solirubrobacteraceae bacterium]
MVLIDPDRRTVDWRVLVGDEHEATATSRLIDLDPATLADMIDWPAASD